MRKNTERDMKEMALLGDINRAAASHPDLAAALLRTLSEATSRSSTEVTGGLQAVTGKSNDSNILRHLIGERIKAAFFASPPGKSHLGEQLYLVMESGPALVIYASPSFGVERSEEVERVCAGRRDEINRELTKLRDMAGVGLP